MTRSIFFDIGQIFVKVDFNRFIHSAAQQCTKDDKYIRGYLDSSKLIKNYTLGQVSTDNFLTKLKEEIAFSGNVSYLANLWSDIFEPINHNIELGRQLKSFYEIYAISNTNELHSKKISAYGVYEIFDKIFLSYEMGVSKPNKQIFKTALKATDSNPEKSVFVDDNKLNVEVANQIGIVSHVVINPDDLKSILENLGITPLEKSLMLSSAKPTKFPR